MNPESVVTIGMASVFISVICGSWIVFRYIGRIENQIHDNENDINKAAQSLREKDLRLLREIKRQTKKIKGIEDFLSQKLDYNSSSDTDVDDTNF